MIKCIKERKQEKSKNEKKQTKQNDSTKQCGEQSFMTNVNKEKIQFNSKRRLLDRCPEGKSVQL